MFCTMRLQLGVRAHHGLTYKVGDADTLDALYTATCRANPTFPPIMSKQVYVYDGSPCM